jgi:hypothetical protein
MKEFLIFKEFSVLLTPASVLTLAKFAFSTCKSSEKHAPFENGHCGISCLFLFLCQYSFQTSLRMENVFFSIQFRIELDVACHSIPAESADVYRSEWKLPSLHKTHWWTNKLSRFLAAAPKNKGRCQNIVLETIQAIFAGPKMNFEIDGV